ncbi:MAG: phospholipase D-like domain-containing protein [Solirubrobacterales bacterium]
MLRGSTKFRLPAVALAAVAIGAVAAAPASAKSTPKLVGASDVSMFVEPDSGVEPVVDFIDSARKTLDYGMYQLEDPNPKVAFWTPITDALKRARARGVKVRVMTTWQTFPASSNTTPGDPEPKSIEYCNYNSNMWALNRLKAAGIKTALSPFPYTYYHEKVAIADGNYSIGKALIMDFNSQISYFGPDPRYSDSGGARGFGVITSNRADVKEIQQTYDADFPPVTTPPAFKRPSLIWSPNGPGFKPKSQGFNRVMQLIDTADKTLDVYVLLLDYAPVRQRLIAAAKRGVTVRVIFNTSGPRAMTFSQLKEMAAAGVQFAHDPTNSVGSVFVHTKTVLRDAAETDRMAYVGSMNVGDYVSVNSERELGILLTRKTITDKIASTYATDWASAKKVQYQGDATIDPFPEPKGGFDPCR